MSTISFKTSFSFFILGLILLPSISYAEVSKFVFTTEPQTIKPGELSAPISIQTQDSDGNVAKTTETIDLEFVSTSPSGEFLGATGNPATKTMSTGSANRTFYYRDSGEGLFTITVNGTGRASGSKFSASQNITVSTSTSVSTTTSQGGYSTTTATTTPTENTPTVYSSHYNSVVITSVSMPAKLEISAGRSRLGAVGGPMEFKAVECNKCSRYGDFVWNFGDGFEAVGKQVVHTYEYPGDYVVILRLEQDDEAAVSRTDVRVIDPRLEIVYADESKIELINKSKYEVNLFGRALVVGDQFFVFPKDTIIKSNQSLIFGNKLTSLAPASMSQVMIAVVGEANSSKAAVRKIEEFKYEKLEELQSTLEVVQDKYARKVYEQSIRPDPTDVGLLSLDKSSTSIGVVLGTSTENKKRSHKWIYLLKTFFLE